MNKTKNVSKNILIIARDFLPYHRSLGGVLRVLKLSEFLTDKGFEVFILSAKGIRISNFGYDSLLCNLNVIYIDDFLKLRNNKRTLRNLAKISEVSSNNERPMSVVKKFIFDSIANILIPDLYILASKKFADKSVKIIKENNIKNVLVSSPPHSTQIIGYLIKKRLKKSINLLVEYRDSWNTIGIFKKTNPILDFISRKLELKILKTADHFIYHSPNVLNKINSLFFDISNKSTLIMNGYDPNMAHSYPLYPKNSTCLTIGHFGSISDDVKSFRNPEKFFKFILTLDIPIKIIFYGYVQISSFWKNTLKNKIEIFDGVSHSEALELMKGMDVLMLLHSQTEGSDEVIPGKIFEYMLVQKPILVIGPKEMECANIVKRKKIGYVMDIYDNSDMALKMAEIYNDWINDKLVKYDQTVCREYSRPFQFEKFLELIE